MVDDPAVMVTSIFTCEGEDLDEEWVMLPREKDRQVEKDIIE